MAYEILFCALLLSRVAYVISGENHLISVGTRSAFQIDIGIVEEVECVHTCPTWTLPSHSDCKSCSCKVTVGEAVKCNGQNVSVLSGYCMTFDPTDNSTYLALCPYGRDVSKYFASYRPLPQDQSQLNSHMCSPFLRHGQICGKCLSGYGPGIFSADVNCYPCSGPYHGWGLYLLFELTPVTIMFFVLMIFQSRGSQGSLNGFLFFSQMATYTYQFTPPPGSYPFGKASKVIIRVYQVIYGMFDLDFFRKVVPPFCVSEHINGLKMTSLLYVAVLYLLLLSAVAYILIELHASNCRLLVCLWRPVHKSFMRLHRNVSPRTTLVDAFVTSLILSYSRFVFISLILLRPTPLYTPDGGIAKLVVYVDGSLDYFSTHHLPYVVLGFAFLLIFNILPVTFLFAYPTTTFQKLIGRSGRLVCILHPFADAFQGCYKNGTNGTRDYRYFAGIYLLLRIIVSISNKMTFDFGSVTTWIIPSVIFLVTALLFANLRPYRRDIFNTMDSIWFSLAAVFTMCQAVIVAKGVESSLGYQIVLQIMLGVPLVYLVCYLAMSGACSVRGKPLCQSVLAAKRTAFPYHMMGDSA